MLWPPNRVQVDETQLWIIVHLDVSDGVNDKPLAMECERMSGMAEINKCGVNNPSKMLPQALACVQPPAPTPPRAFLPNAVA
jgi:hypothetical protein